MTISSGQTHTKDHSLLVLSLQEQPMPRFGDRAM